MGGGGSKIKTEGKTKEQIIIEKLLRANKQAAALSDEELIEWARTLCEPEGMRECYLNPDFAHTVTIFEGLEKKQQDIESKPKDNRGNLVPISRASEMTSKPVVPQPMEDVEVEQLVDEDFGMDSLQHEEEENPIYKSLKSEGKQVRVKLVLGEICKSNVQKTFRRMMSPVLTKFDTQQTFGIVHSALVVGPWYIEWNTSSLCIPRKCYSGAALIAADLDIRNSKTVNMEEAISKLTNIIIDWNTHRVYDSKKNNCQTFVDDVLKEFGVDMKKFKGPFGEYLKRMRMFGQCEIEFPISSELREKAELREAGRKQFGSHKEIDEFVQMIVDKFPTFEREHEDEWALLKSFDRAFWLRHWKDKTDARFIPIEAGCPFQDPEQTTSLKKEWF